MADEKDVAGSSPQSALENAIASSPEALEQVKQQVQGTETGTPQEPVSQEQPEQPEPQQEEEGKIPYSRFREVNEEKNWYKQQMEQLLQQRQQPQQLAQPTQLPEDYGQTPEEREFWRKQREIARQEAQKELQKLNPLIDATRQELARIGTTLFRKDHPDVKASSPEEMEIAQKINMGYTPDDAYKIVMWDKRDKVIEQQTKQQVKQKIETKKQANVETSGSVPLQAQTPLKRSMQETAEHYWKQLQEGKL